MPETYEPIATTTLSSAATSITLSSISSSYTDLKLIFTWLGNGGESYSPDITFNGDSNSNYSYTIIYGNGTSVGSTRESNFTRIEAPNSRSTTTIPGFYEVDIFSYRASVNKTVFISANSDRNASGFVEKVVGLWRNTAAITSITLTSAVSDFASGTTATLYGILKA